MEVQKKRNTATKKSPAKKHVTFTSLSAADSLDKGVFFNNPDILARPSDAVKKYLTASNKKDSPHEKEWETEFYRYIYNFLGCIYGSGDQKSTEYRTLAVTDPRFRRIWKKAFTDETESADSYEAMELVGDRAFGYAFSKYIYQIKNGFVSPGELSNILNFYASNDSMLKMASNLRLSDWVILGSEDVPITPKIKGNMIETISAALDFVAEGIRSIYLYDKKDYEAAARLPTGFDANRRLISTYFDYYTIDQKAYLLPSKSFIVQIGMLFGHGLTSSQFIKKTKDSWEYYISEPLSLSIAENIVSVNEGDKNAISVTERRAEIMKANGLTDTDDSILAERVAAILEKVGVTKEWYERTREFVRVDTVPEPFRSSLLATLDKYQRYTFEVPYTHKTENTVTVIMYKSQSNEKGNQTVWRKKVMHITGEVNEGQHDRFPYSLRNQLVKNFLSSNK